MERYAWRAKVMPGKLTEYEKRHDEIWPEMVKVLREAGIRNYSIWVEGLDLFGYYECDDVVETGRIQSLSPVVAKWNEFMKDVMTMSQDPRTGAQPLLRQVFLLE